MPDAPAPTPTATPSPSASPAPSQGSPQPGQQAPADGGLDALLAPPAATRQARQEQSDRLRRALSTGEGISDALFGEDVGSGQPADTGFANIPTGDVGEIDYVEEQETLESAEPEQATETVESLRRELDEHRAMQQYYGVVYDAIQQVAAQNEALQRQLDGARQIDEDLVREAQERARLAEIPDRETDPDGYFQHMLQETVRGEIETIIGREREASEEHARQQQQQQIATAANADIDSCVTQWPELGAALEAYRDHAVAYYQGLGASPQDAAKSAFQAIWNTAYQASAQGQSAGEALYKLTGAWDFAQAGEPAAVPEATPEPVPAGQRFVDRAEGGTPLAAATAVKSQTDDQRIQSLMLKAGQGDQKSMVAFLKEARDLGDPRNVEGRRRIMAAFGQPM